MPPLAGERNIVLAPAAHPLQGPVDTLGEGIVGDGLEHKVHGVHGVALHHILGHIGDEDDNHLHVQLPDALGGGHAVHVAHFNIHEDDVVFRPVILYDLHTVGKKGKTKALAAFGFIALEKVYQLAAVGIVVLYDSNADQGAHPLKVVSILYNTKFTQGEAHFLLA